VTQPLSDLARQFRFNLGLLQRFAGDLSPEEWSRPASEQGGNSPHWVLGHLARARRGILRRLGEELEPEAWEDAFARGAGTGQGAGWAPVEELLADFARSDERLAERLVDLDAHDAAERWDAGFPDGSETVEQGVRFVHFHEVYHLGQLGLLRRLLGKDSIR